MRELPTYTPDFEEYIRQGEPAKKERAQIWRTAIGLQQVDGLETSEYLRDVARRHIEGDITLKEVKSLIDSYYKTENVRNMADAEDRQEADKVSQRIAELLSQQTFTFSPAQLIAIHRHLFQGIYKFAGKIRDYNITKKEWVLRGEPVYLERFFRNLIMGENNVLLNREMHLDWKEPSSTPLSTPSSTPSSSRNQFETDNENIIRLMRALGHEKMSVREMMAILLIRL